MKAGDRIQNETSRESFTVLADSELNRKGTEAGVIEDT
jgi:hypothetical protein